MMVFSLLADEALTKLAADTNVTRRELEVAEAAKMEPISAENQSSDAAAGPPSILVLNDLWRYVPAYFQTLDAVQPRSEAGRRLLERRRRQIERQQQQQQQSDVTAAENERGTLPVDQLLEYITNSATNNAALTSTSYKGRRRKKQSTPSHDAVVNSASSSSHVQLDDKDDNRGENVPHEVVKKDVQPDDTAANDATEGDATDFVVVRRGRKYRPVAAERPTQLQTELQLGTRRRHKATFYDSLDEFSLQDDKVVTPRADQVDCAASDDKRFVSATTISESTQLSQTKPLSVSISDVSDYCTNTSEPGSSSSDSVRPVTLRYNEAVKRNRSSCLEKSEAVDVSAQNSVSKQSSRPTSDVACVQTTNFSTVTNGDDEQDVRVLTIDGHPVDVPTTSWDRDPVSTNKKHMAVGRVVETVSCSTQTSMTDVPRYSTPPPSNNNSTEVIIENVNPPTQRSDPVVFVDAAAMKADSNEVLRGGSGLYFGSFDDISSTSLRTEPCYSDKLATPSESVAGRCSDAATSPIKLSPSPSSDMTPLTAAGHCRRITPLCRTTGSSACALGAPVGIVPPIMHVVPASGDVSVFIAEPSTREEVSHQYTALLCGL